MRLAGHVARACVEVNVDGTAWCVGGLACWLKVINQLVDQVCGVVVLVVCILVVCVICALRSVSCRCVESVGSVLVVCAALAVRHVRAVLLAC